MTATAPCPLPVRARRSAEEPPVADLPTAELVCAARRRDHGAWEELVGRYGGMVRGVASSYRLSESDVADVAQNTWLRAFERLDTLREADRVGGWLATIARRECLAVLRRSVREVTDGLLDDDVRSTAPGPEATVLAGEARGMVRRAVAELPVRRRAGPGHPSGQHRADPRAGAAHAAPGAGARRPHRGLGRLTAGTVGPCRPVPGTRTTSPRSSTPTST